VPTFAAVYRQSANQEVGLIKARICVEYTVKVPLRGLELCFTKFGVRMYETSHTGARLGADLENLVRPDLPYYLGHTMPLPTSTAVHKLTCSFPLLHNSHVLPGLGCYPPPAPSEQCTNDSLALNSSPLSQCCSQPLTLMILM
jgi:hypothetical protein